MARTVSFTFTQRATTSVAFDPTSKALTVGWQRMTADGSLADSGRRTFHAAPPVGEGNAPRALRADERVLSDTARRALLVFLSHIEHDLDDLITGDPL
jgi:hypothetical protein